MQNKDPWEQAASICKQAERTSQKTLATKYGSGTVSMAVRAYPRAEKYNMLDWNYRAVCATLSIPDRRFTDFLKEMEITRDLSVRTVQIRAAKYKQHIMEAPEPEAIRTDLDYIVIDGKRFWIVPEKVQEFKALLEDQIQ